MPTIPQSERHGERLAVVYYNESTQTWEQRPLSGDSVGNASVIDGITQVPRYGVMPTIGGATVPMILLDAGGGDVWHVRYTINPGDAATAASRLAAGGPDVFVLSPDNVEAFSSGDTAITDIYVLCVGDGTGADNGAGVLNGTGAGVFKLDGTTSVGDCVRPEITAAQIITADSMVHFQFSADDAVRSGAISMGVLVEGGTRSYLTLGGRSHA